MRDGGRRSWRDQTGGSPAPAGPGSEVLREAAATLNIKLICLDMSKIIRMGRRNVVAQNSDNC